MKYPKWQLLILAIAAFTLSNCNTADTTQDQSTTTESTTETLEAKIEKLAIQQPLENIEVYKQVHTVDAAEAQTISMDNGSSIEVPANAFVDANGQAVTGAVDIEYREFHTPAQIIASGIPMTVITDEGEEWMQTAGMFEIEGKANGTAVFIAEGKALNVNMASEVDGAYDFWYFDEEQGNWDNLGTSQPTPNTAVANEVATPARAAVSTPQPPRRPRTLKKEYALNFELDYTQFPSLKDKEGVVWQYNGDSPEDAPSNNTWIYSEDWTDIELKHIKGEEYQVILTSDRKDYSIIVVPVLTGDDYEAAMEAYRLEFQAYEAAIATANRPSEVALQRSAFLRSYQVQNFGVYNYDVLYKDPKRVQLAASFEFDGVYNTPIFKEAVQVFLITADDRAVVKFNDSSRDYFSVNPNAKNKLVAILPGNKIAVLDEAAFEAQKEDILAAEGGEYIFYLPMVETAVASVEELDQVIL
ncbi:MAG: hypothetical protein AAGI49_07865 [Bacteroidota bacterium]